MALGHEDMNSIGVRQQQDLREPDVLQIDQEERELLAARERQAEVLRMLWERRQLLLRAAAVGFVLSVLVALLIPNTYTSTAQLMPPDTQASSGMAMLTALAGKTLGPLAGLSGDLLSTKSAGPMFIGVLRSETCQDRIVQRFDLQRVYGIKLIGDARKHLDDNTDIKEDRKSGIITIRVEDRNAQRAAAIANAYIDELNSLSAQLSTSAAHRERVFLEDRLKVAKQELDSASNQLAQFSSKNNTLDIQIEGKAMLDAASSLTGQLIAAESQLQGLREIYTDNNSRVRALSGRVAELRKQLEKFGGTEQSAQGPTTNNGRSALVNGTDPPTDKSVNGPFPTIRSLPLLGEKYSDYYRQTKVQETVFELLTEQYELAKVQEVKETPSVKVLDPARVPERKSAPARWLIVSLGTLLAFGVAGIWVLGTKSWEEIDPGDPRKSLAQEVAGTLRANVPWGANNNGGPHSWRERIWSRLKSPPPPSGGSPV
jgi:capsule polysaccharide export protein KpsE/RkpR